MSTVMTPTVDAIVPTHNRVDPMGEILESTLDKILGDFEVVAVDDGLTDPTDRVAEAFGGPRLRHLRQKESGFPAKSRNVGMGTVRTRYFAFWDLDKIWPPDLPELQVTCVDGRPEVACMFTKQVVFSSG